MTTSARQLFAFIRGGHGHGEMPSFPEAIEGPLPKKPNVYTDGGLKHPESNLWCLGGFGIWWPSGLSDGPNKQLHKFTHQQAIDEGVLMWNSLPGLGCSSTRTELAAVIMACIHPQPLHIASDSKAMIDKAQMLIRHAITWELSSRTSH